MWSMNVRGLETEHGQIEHVEINYDAPTQSDSVQSASTSQFLSFFNFDILFEKCHRNWIYVRKLMFVKIFSSNFKNFFSKKYHSYESS